MIIIKAVLINLVVFLTLGIVAALIDDHFFNGKLGEKFFFEKILPWWAIATLFSLPITLIYVIVIW